MDELEAAIYGDMVWNTPLSAEHAQRLLDRVDGATAASLLDLGCGWGELLLRAVAGAAPGCRAVGVDSDATLLARARRAARERGLGRVARFVQADASSWTAPADVVLCLGAAHAWGGARAALHRLRAVVMPGGRLLFGDGCWAAAPTAAAAEIFGDEVIELAQLRDAARRAGWRVGEVTCADLEEWDAFEGSFRSGRERWAAEHPDDPRAAIVAREMAARREEYETVYRGVLGFAYLALEAPDA